MEKRPSSRDIKGGIEILCQKCGDPVTRYFMDGERDGQQQALVCACERGNMISITMPELLKNITTPKELLNHQLMDMIDQSVVVFGVWADLRRVMRAWHARRNPLGKIQVLYTTDSTVRDIGSGGHSRKEKGDEYAGPIYSGIDDYVGPAALMIIGMGGIKTGTKDDAYFQGKIAEAFNARVSAGKPTWMMIDPEKSWSKAHYPFVWSQDVEDMVAEWPNVHIRPKLDKVRAERSNLLVGDEERPVRRSPRPAPKEPEPEIDGPQEDDGLTGGLSIYGSGVKQSPSKSRKRN